MRVYHEIYIYKRIVQAKLFIDHHFCDDIDLHNIASEAYFSKFHFVRLFKTIYGKTPHQYLIKVRLENAKILLEKNATVMDTCFGVGFSSVTSFTELFKIHFRISPSKYRSAYKQRQDQIKAYPFQFVPNCFIEQKDWNQKSNFQEVL